ncbi:MAG: hydrolase [Woeseiaceae bacterium]
MILRSEFKPAPGFGNRHWQTLLPALGLVETPNPPTRREILPLPDGDSLALDWLAKDASPDAPLLVILHGLEGSSESSYAKGLIAEAASRHWQAVVMNFRDCGDHRNRLSRRYHAGETGDIEFLASELRTRLPNAPMFYAGFSLGANVLLKHLGESADEARCIAAVGVSVPFELQMASDSISKGFSKLYQWHLMRNMKKALRRKFDPMTAPFDFDAAMKTSTFEAFDDLVTAPLHGFDGKDDYYSSSSSRQYLKSISRPTLVIHAEDDPFMNTDMIPTAKELSSSVVLELSDKGGHVGFIEGDAPWRLHYWLPKRIAHFLNVQYENGLRSR